PNAPGGPGGFTGNGPVPKGGGALRITAINLLLDGTISANGLSGTTNGNGGGAGGSLWLTVNNFSGAGGLLANGGGGHLPTGGGAGGGRIAILYTSNSFTGTMSAKGGAGFKNGGAGTIYLRPNNDILGGTLIVDNGGLAGTNTPLDSGPLRDLQIVGRSSV